MFQVNSERLQTKRIEQAEQAQNDGTAPIRASEAARQRRDAAYKQMVETIKSADTIAFDQAINEFLVLPAYGDYLTRAAHVAIIEENEHAARKLLSIERTCQYRISNSNSLWSQAANASSEEYLAMLVAANCGVQELADKEAVRKHLTRSKFPLFALDNIDASSRTQATMNTMLRGAIIDNRADDALALLERGADPKFVPKLPGRTLLELTQSPRLDLDEVAVALIDAGAELIVQRENESTRYLLVTAVKQGKETIVARMLEKDSEQITRENLSKRLLDIMDRTKPTTAVLLTSLIDHGLDLAANPNWGPQLLMRAARRADPDLTEYLLQLGVDPNHLLVVTTILGEARKVNHENSAKVVALLEKYGALDDVLAQARALRPEALACRRNNKQVIPRLNDLSKEIAAQGNPSSAGESIRASEACELTVQHCKNQGMGFDDCLNSAPACKADGTGAVLCCETEVVERYFEGRCAGLTVQEAVVWTDYFDSLYGMPRILAY